VVVASPVVSPARRAEDDVDVAAWGRALAATKRRRQRRRRKDALGVEGGRSG
jgi:hypothetical protein